MDYFQPPAGALPSLAPQPGPRLYHPPTKPDFQLRKHKLEKEWLPAMQELLRIDTDQLPIILGLRLSFGPQGQARGRYLCVMRNQCQLSFALSGGSNSLYSGGYVAQGRGVCDIGPKRAMGMTFLRDSDGV